MINWYDRIGNRIEMKLYEDADKSDFEWVKGSVIEGYRYKDGIVSMKSDDGRIIWCGVESGDFRKSEDSLGDFISNADRIHSFSDEELAMNMMCPNENGLGEIECEKSDNCNCYACILKWLQSEVEEEAWEKYQRKQ